MPPINYLHDKLDFYVTPDFYASPNVPPKFIGN